MNRRPSRRTAPTPEDEQDSVLTRRQRLLYQSATPEEKFGSRPLKARRIVFPAAPNGLPRSHPEV